MLPIYACADGGLQGDYQLALKRTRRTRGWPEKALRLCGDERLLRRLPDGTPERSSTITSVIVVEVTEWHRVSNEEAGRPVAHSLVDLGQRKCNLSHATELKRTHTEGTWMQTIALEGLPGPNV